MHAAHPTIYYFLACGNYLIFNKYGVVDCWPKHQSIRTGHNIFFFKLRYRLKILLYNYNISLIKIKTRHLSFAKIY